MTRPLIAALMISLSTGCASIFKGAHQSVIFTSTPPGATVTITDRRGVTVHHGVTPFTATVKRGHGYFGGNDLTVVASMPGYATQLKHMYCELSGWYFGNIVFGGLIGMLIVDPLTGGMFRVDDHLNFYMVPSPPTTAPTTR